MFLGFRALAALAKEPGSILGTRHTAQHRLNTWYCVLGHQHTGGAHPYMHVGGTLRHIKQTSQKVVRPALEQTEIGRAL